MKRKQTPESNALEAICEYLAIRKYTFWRVNNTPSIQNDKYGFRFRAMPKYGMKGVSDIILLIDGKAVFLEVKAKGKQSEHQKKFQKLVEGAKCQYYIVRSIGDLIALKY